MQKTKIKKIAIVSTTALITIISLIEINRKHEYKLIAQSADALEIQINDDKLWTSKNELNVANTQVNNAINDLYVEAIEAGIDVEEVTQGASSQAEAIYLVQGALKATEQQSTQESETPSETTKTPVEENTNEETEQSEEVVPPVEEPNTEEEQPTEEPKVEEEQPVDETKPETPVEEPPTNTTPEIESVAPTINNLAVNQTSNATEVNVSFDLTTNGNEIKKITLKVENETGATKTGEIPITPNNTYSVNITLPEGNYKFSVIVEYVDAATKQTTKTNSEEVNIDVITNYYVEFIVTQGDNPGDILIDLTNSILPNTTILCDVYVDGEVYEKNARLDDMTITLNDVSDGAHEYQVVAKYLTNREIQEIQSEKVTFSTTSEPVITNFVVNQNIDPITNEITVDLSFDLEDNENIVTSITATATNVETQEIYNLEEILMVESKEEIMSFNNVAKTVLPPATYDFNLVVEYIDGESTSTVTAVVKDYELILESKPEEKDIREKIKTKIESI